MSGMAGKPPASPNSERRTKMPWSPVAMPVRRERRFIIRRRACSTHGLPPIVTSKRPQDAPRDTASPIAAAAVAGSSESACRKSRTSPRGLARAEVHLRGAPGGGDVRAVGEQARDQQRRIAAAAVDDDHFVALRAQRLQRRQRGGDRCGFLEGRNDDGKTHARSANVGEESGGWLTPEAQA